jgi:hypothetical protein
MGYDHSLAPSGPGTVVLTLGADLGALVIHAPARCHGVEIEISPAGGAPRTHAAVRARHLPVGIRYCAVLDGLPAGEYVVWRDRTTPAGRVRVRGGTVAEFVWPA